MFSICLNDDCNRRRVPFVTDVAPLLQIMTDFHGINFSNPVVPKDGMTRVHPTAVYGKSVSCLVKIDLGQTPCTQRRQRSLYRIVFLVDFCKYGSHTCRFRRNQVIVKRSAIVQQAVRLPGGDGTICRHTEPSALIRQIHGFCINTFTGNIQPFEPILHIVASTGNAKQSHRTDHIYLY